MRTHRLILCLTLLLTLGACSSTRKAPVAPKPVAKAQVRKDYLKPGDIRRVRTGEFVKTYHMGRSVSGRNGSTLHEAHRVYRLEKPSRWNLARDQPPLASTGPVNRIVDSAFTPPSQSQAIRAELNRQREVTGELESARDELKATVATARAKLSEASKSAAVVGPLKKEIERLRSENEALRQVRHSNGDSGEAKSKNPGDALREWGAGLDGKSSEQGEQDQ